MEKDILIFTVAQGRLYERLASNLFRSIRLFNQEVTTACISLNKPSFCDIHIPLDRDVNEFCIEGQSYSFKLGILPHIKDVLKDFKKLVYIDSDSECVDRMYFDESIYKSDFYSAWCQSIVTEDKNIKSRISPDWNWLGQDFRKHAEFALENGIKEWKNVNGGLIVISCDKIDFVFEKFTNWMGKVNSFYNKNAGNDEMIMSLILAEMYPDYKTPDICKNGICQLNMSCNPKTIRKEKSFVYDPWFNSSGSTLVKATCVHSPGGKNTLVADIPE